MMKSALRGDGRKAFIDAGEVWCRRCAAARWGAKALIGNGARDLGLGVVPEGAEGAESCEQCGGPCSADLRVPAEVDFAVSKRDGRLRGILKPAGPLQFAHFGVTPGGLVTFDRPEEVSSVQRRHLANVLRYRGGDRAYYVVAGPPYAAGAKYVIDARTGDLLTEVPKEAVGHGS